MQNLEITTHAQLLSRIQQLKADKTQQEDDLKNAFHGFVHAINPVTIAKDSLHELAGNIDVQFDIIKMGLNMGANLIIDKVLGKHRSIKGFLSSLVVEKFSTILINNNLSDIVLTVSDLILGSDDKKENHTSPKKQLSHALTRMIK